MLKLLGVLALAIHTQGTVAQTSDIFPPVGAATLTPGTTNCYTLTVDQQYIMGAVWFDPKIDLSQPFDIWATLNFGTNFQWDGSNVSNIYPEAGGGADGIAFVLQQVDSAAGNLGEAMGYGLIDPSLAIEFDSYYNFNADPIYDHIAISKNGNHIHTGAPYGNFSEGTLLPGSTVVPALGTDPVADNLHTGNAYQTRFNWDPATSELEVWFDCQLKFTHQEDIINTLFGGNQEVFYGFTSATGSEYNIHEVCVLYNSTTFNLSDTSICVGNSVQLDATLDDPAFTYSWSPAAGLDNPNSPTPIATPTATTTYTVSISHPCYPDPITESMEIVVTNVSGPQITQIGTLCSSDKPVDLVATPTGGTWSGAGITDPTTGTFDPEFISGSTTVIYTMPGICAGSDTITIFVEDPPAPEFTASIHEGCAPLTVTFTPAQVGNSTNCFWDFGDGTTSTSCGSVTHTFTSTGCFDISFSAEVAQNCSASLTLDDLVCVHPNPVAGFTFSPGTLSIPSSTLVQFTNQSQGGHSYLWDFGSTTSPLEDPFFDFASASTSPQICLTTTTEHGCVDTYCASIPITEEVIFYVPNSFTPDDDEYNQFFAPVFSSGYDPYSYTLLIFNRWGQIIFESNDTSVGWDGVYNGLRVQDGTYTWKIRFKEANIDKYHEAIGHVNVLR